MSAAPDSMSSRSASRVGTRRFRSKAEEDGINKDHFKEFQSLSLSSLGIGTYLGDPDALTDSKVTNAIELSIASRAINVIDTAINYRFQRAERSIGRTLKSLFEKTIFQRDEIFICTKNGYLTHDGELNIDFWEYIHSSLIKPGVISQDDISSQMHCMTPKFLEDQLERSLRNLRLECIDLLYLHNSAESQLPDVARSEFLERLRDVFELYEGFRQSGKILYYGLATWACFRVSPSDPLYLSIEEVFSIARNVGGEGHGFRFIQLPFNLSMTEAYLTKNQSIQGELLSPLAACRRLGIGVFTSVPLMQGQMLRYNPPEFTGLDSTALINLQIVRSTPGVLAPMVGQKDPEHVKENLRLARHPLLDEESFSKIKWI